MLLLQNQCNEITTLLQQNHTYKVITLKEKLKQKMFHVKQKNAEKENNFLTQRFGFIM